MLGLIASLIMIVCGGGLIFFGTRFFIEGEIPFQIWNTSYDLNVPTGVILIMVGVFFIILGIVKIIQRNSKSATKSNIYKHKF